MHENHQDNPTALLSKAASAAEVKQYLQQMEGNDPDEQLGVDAKAGLIRASVEATVLSVVLLVAGTLVPYWWPGLFSHAAAPSKPAEQARDTDKNDIKDLVTPTKSEPKTATPEPTKTAADKTAKQPVSKEALDKLGVNDTKAASPKVNPLDKSADDLFKDLDKK